MKYHIDIIFVVLLVIGCGWRPAREFVNQLNRLADKRGIR
jgi:hypothetical protein